MIIPTLIIVFLFLHFYFTQYDLPQSRKHPIVTLHLLRNPDAMSGLRNRCNVTIIGPTSGQLERPCLENAILNVNVSALSNMSYKVSVW